MAAQNQQNGKGSRKGVRERKVERERERESNEKKIFKWGRAVCVCRVFSILHCNIFGWTLLGRTAFAACIFTLNTNIERLHYFSPPFLLLFFSFHRALHDCTMESRRCSSFTHWLITEGEYIYFQLSIQKIPFIKCDLFYFLTDFKHNAKTRTTCICHRLCPMDNVKQLLH